MGPGQSPCGPGPISIYVNINRTLHGRHRPSFVAGGKAQ